MNLFIFAIQTRTTHLTHMKKCPNCGAYIMDNASFCQTCGAHIPQTPPPYGSTNNNDYREQYIYRNNAFDSDPDSGKSRGVAGLLAIFLGGIGVQYFYLGKVGAGLITILLSIITCGIWEIVTLIQGILMLCMTNQEFCRKYVYTNSSFPLF